jgi:hypothetical protein
MIKIKKLMLAIGIVSGAAFLNLLWICLFSPEMIYPINAIKLLWLPNMPLFILLCVTTFLAFRDEGVILPLMLCFVPIFFIGGLLGLSGLKIIFMHSFSLFFFEPCLLGLFQLILALLIITGWLYQRHIET